MATALLFRLGFTCSVAAFLLMFLAFATPYWYKSWTRVHSPFSNIGLWHVCLAGFIEPNDPEMKSYVGCWWIHSSEFRRVANLIQPNWFRGIQALSIFALMCNLGAAILLLLYLPDVVYKKLYAGRRVKVLFLSAILELAAAFLVFMIALVFAEMSNDPQWMPRPWMNYLSWSYGVCVLSGFFSAFSGMFVFIMGLIFRDKERGVIGSDTLDTRLEKIKKDEIEFEKRMMQAPPSYGGGDQSFNNPSMGNPSTGYPSTGYPSTGYPSTGGYRDPSMGGLPAEGGEYYSKGKEAYDTSSYRDDKISVASSQRDDRQARIYPEAGQQRRAMYSGQPRSAYRREPQRVDHGYQPRTGSEGSASGEKAGESVV